jgi:glycosyltransferase involved in cell wall biosynthesis
LLPGKYDQAAQLLDAGMIRRILYVQFTDPAAYPPVEHSTGLFAARGWEVTIIGTGTFGGLNLQLPTHPRICVKKIGFVRGGWGQKLQYIFFAVLLLYWTWRWKPSWIYGSDPLTCPIVWLIRKLTMINVVYHEHDSPSCEQDQSKFMRWVFAFRSRLAKDAELCLLPQRGRLCKFLKKTGRTKPVFCVWNCPRVDETVNVNLGHNKGLIIYYHGSISGARLPSQLIIAASRFNGAVRLRVAGYEAPGSIGYMAELTALAAKHGVGEMIELLGTIPFRKDLLLSASEAHVGLSLMPKQSDDINMQHMVGASNKPFDYMACGLPLLVTDLPEWRSTFVKPGYGRACDPEDPDSIEAALRWYLEHPEQRREMGKKCKVKIRQAWNYENEFASVLATIERANGVA